ncbi:hypothetical protein KGF57_002174 [Candida theae]|uniref:Uncharacterized protein n=1 Tax=Candida theae TaxID=1198502 RepID=A0AAD5FYZ8_9ASCO|nr:uncharacterized protein KGF57_002174 [Candida theae]KAI5959236.1 hypothetical protein KGF57_002174 [Candida theae]
MSEEEIDAFDIELKPKIKPLFKKKQVHSDTSTSRKTIEVAIDNVTGTEEGEGPEYDVVSDIRRTSPNTTFKPRFKRKVTDPDPATSRRTTTTTVTVDDESVNEINENKVDELGTACTPSSSASRDHTVLEKTSASRKAKAILIDDEIEKDEVDEMDEDEDEIRIKPLWTFQRRGQPESSKRRLNLSKYKVNLHDETAQAEPHGDFDVEGTGAKGQAAESSGKPVPESDINISKNDPIIADADNDDVEDNPADKESAMPAQANDPSNFLPPSAGQHLDLPTLPELGDDDDDPENNPVIANIDELRDMFSREREASLHPDIKLPNGRSASYEPPSTSFSPPPPPNLPRSYVPIQSNAEPTLSKRQYLNQIASEYNDAKNYDDGAASSTNREPRPYDFAPGSLGGDTIHDYELSDEDMGVLKRKIDFENRYNDEIVSDYGSSVSEDDHGGYRRNFGPNFEPVDNDFGYGYGVQHKWGKPKQSTTIRVPTIQEQIKRIEHLIKLERAKHLQKSMHRANLLKRKEEIRKERDVLVQKLQNWQL